MQGSTQESSHILLSSKSSSYIPSITSAICYCSLTKYSVGRDYTRVWTPEDRCPLGYCGGGLSLQSTLLVHKQCLNWTVSSLFSQNQSSTVELPSLSTGLLPTIFKSFTFLRKKKKAYNNFTQRLLRSQDNFIHPQ